MSENISNQNLRERKIEIAPSKHQLSSGSTDKFGVLTRDVMNLHRLLVEII